MSDGKVTGRNEFGRRTLLRAAGVGAGALAASTVLGRSDAVAAAPRSAVRPATADLPLVSGPEFPIGLFWPPPPFQTTLARYQEIADAGMNFVITGDYLSDSYVLNYLMGFADQVGIQVLVSDDPRLGTPLHSLKITDDRSVPLSISIADTTTLLSQTINSYQAHPSFIGFDVFDEPNPTELANVGAAIDILRGLAPNLLPYSNLYPGNGDGYRAFVQSYIDTVKPSLLSFDRYPILTSGIDINYFDNWAIHREAGLAVGIPTWTYIQSVGYNGHRVPNAAELQWQINISLAYGCKGIQYFTYWTPDPARGEGFFSALLTVDGQQTPLYSAARSINTGWLRPVGRELKPLVSESVQHANDTPLPPGTTAFTPGAQLTSLTGDALVLGFFRADPDNGTRWLLAANRSESASARSSITTKVTSVSRFNPPTGRYTGLGHPGRIDVDLDPGAATLYRLT